MNPQLVTSRTGNNIHIKNDKASYIRNLLCNTGSIDSSPDRSLKGIAIAEGHITHHSVNPREHLYSREVDFMKPRKTRVKNLQQQTYDYESARRGSVDEMSYSHYLNGGTAKKPNGSRLQSSNMGNARNRYAVATTRAQTSHG